MLRSQIVPRIGVMGVLASLPMVRNPGRATAAPQEVNVKLTEWAIELSQSSIPAGEVTFTVSNAGSIPHAFEVEGKGIEQQTSLIQPGGSVTLTLNLKSGEYEVYCPVGQDSHKHLGMEADLEVGKGKSAPRAMAPKHAAMMEHEGMMGHPPDMGGVKGIKAIGAGAVVQILPGAFPFPDSAGPILASFGEEHEALESQAMNGPYSNNVTTIGGNFSISAWERGGTRDSVSGVANFTGQDGAKWKVVIDRVQTNDVPHHPKFGGVIMGLYYHGNTGVHTPLVPTINSAVALWAIAHLYKNDQLVTDNAMVHVMLLSRTRHEGDWKLACWDCSKNKVEELQLQVTPAPGEPKFDAPGGFLFVNWEGSRWEKLAS